MIHWYKQSPKLNQKNNIYVINCATWQNGINTRETVFEAIFVPISKFDLNLDSVGVSSSKGANKGNSIWQILYIGLKKGKIMIFN